MKIVAIKIEGNGTFAQDVPALAEAIKASGAEVVLLPGNSRAKLSAAAAAAAVPRAHRPLAKGGRRLRQPRHVKATFFCRSDSL